MVRAVKSFADEGRVGDVRMDSVGAPRSRAAIGHAGVPDILCLQEIENQQVLADLAERFGRGAYAYWAIGGPQNGVIHSGVLSRFPIVALRTHAVLDAWGFGPMRDILEVEVKCGDFGNIILFVCHWKSKMEGAKETEPARRASAALLVDRIRMIEAEQPGVPIIVCGDFNESPDEYLRIKRAYPTGIMPLGLGSQSSSPEGAPLYASNSWEELKRASTNTAQVALYNVWSETPSGFSIAYKESREQFDSFFLNAACRDGVGIEFKEFRVADAPELFAEDGTPLEWRGSQGFSDHLPVQLLLGSEGQ